MECEQECQQCGGHAVLLGAMGNLAHFRCRNCGWVFAEQQQFALIPHDESEQYEDNG